MPWRGRWYLDFVRDLVFLANGNARLGEQGAVAAKDALEAEGFTIRQFEVIKDGAKFAERLRHFVSVKTPYIAIGGGDGTQRSAVEVIAGTEVVLVAVPLGTGNAWAKELGIPVEPKAMAQAVASGMEKQIDVGMANGRAFINIATVGLSAAIARNLNDRAKGRFGRAAYMPAVLKSIGNARSFRVHVKTDDAEYEDRVLQFVAAAGRTHAGPFRVTTHAENDDGKLSLYALHDTDRRGLLRFGWALLRGQHTELDEVWCCETASATVTTKPRKTVIVDGEAIGRTPLMLSVRPGALKVLVPAETAV